MAREHGFKFEIKGTVFVPQKSQNGVDVVAAYEAANSARQGLVDAFADLPCEIAISAPVATSRPAPPPEVEVGDNK